MLHEAMEGEHKDSSVLSSKCNGINGAKIGYARKPIQVEFGFPGRKSSSQTLSLLVITLGLNICFQKRIGLFTNVPV
jgi:hypothetical protein